MPNGNTWCYVNFRCKTKYGKDEDTSKGSIASQIFKTTYTNCKHNDEVVELEVVNSRWSFLFINQLIMVMSIKEWILSALCLGLMVCLLHNTFHLFMLQQHSSHVHFSIPQQTRKDSYCQQDIVSQSIHLLPTWKDVVTLCS